MCQAIAKPEGVVVGRKVLARAWDENPHGAGFAYLDGEQVIIRKGYFRFNEFWKEYRQHREKACIIHFRLATHGSKTEANCHPFEIVPNVALIHNGILSNFIPEPSSDMSDTRYFCSTYLSPYIPTDIESAHATLEHNRTLIEEVIDFSKLAVLTPKGFIIYNEKFGDWINGAWYSAGYPKSRRQTYLDQQALLAYGARTYLSDRYNETDPWDEYYRQERQAGNLTLWDEYNIDPMGCHSFSEYLAIRKGVSK